METVVTETAHGSVDYFVALLRKHAPRWTQIGSLGLEYIKVFVESDYRTDAETMEAIRNILAAVEIMRAELAEVAR